MITNDDLIGIINTSSTLQEVCERSRLSYGTLMTRAYRLRKRGVILKRFERPGQLGVVGWLREYHPAIYQDLKNNYPEIYANVTGR